MFRKLAVSMTLASPPARALDYEGLHRPLKDHEAEPGDPTEFFKGAYRSLILAYSPD